jgi:hypothetical protein
MISDPLRRLGVAWYRMAAARLVTTPEIAKKLKKPQVRLIGQQIRQRDRMAGVTSITYLFSRRADRT